MSIRSIEDEKIDDFTYKMTDSLRKHDYAMYKLLIHSTPSGFYSFVLRPTALIIDAVRVR